MIDLTLSAPASASAVAPKKVVRPKPPKLIFVSKENYSEILKACPAAPALETLLEIV